MRKLIIVLTILTIFCLSGCSKIEEYGTMDNDIFIGDNQEEEYQTIDSEVIMPEGEYTQDYIFYDSLELSQYIASGTFGETRVVKGFSDYYESEFIIKEMIKGEIEERTIKLYTGYDHKFDQSEEYIVFLEANVPLYYTHVAYRLIFDSYVITDATYKDEFYFMGLVSDGIQTPDNVIIENSIDLKEYIKSEIRTSFEEQVEVIEADVMSIESIEQYIDKSNAIVTVYISEIILDGEYVNVVSCQNKDNIRGNLPSEIVMILPKTLELGKEYTLFIKETALDNELVDINAYIEAEDEQLINILYDITEYGF